MLKPGEIAFNGLPNARIGEMVCHACALRFVCQLFAKLREVVLTLGILHVGSECGTFLHEMTPPAEQVARRAHFGGIHIRLRDHSAP